MTVLIDPPAWPAHGRRWSHLVSDSSFDELHAFARRAGIPERGFEGDHYDVPEERYAGLVAAGAVPVTSRELLRRLQGAGLRRRKRRGERILASLPGGARHRGAGRVDVVLSAKPPLEPVRTVVLAAVAPADGGQQLLVLPEGDDWVLPQRSAPATTPLVHPLTRERLETLAEAIATDLLGAGAAPAAVQVGYTRAVPAPGAQAGERPGEADVLLGVVLAGPVAPGQDGARWTGLRDALGLLPPTLAPLLRSWRLPVA